MFEVVFAGIMIACWPEIEAWFTQYGKCGS